jgi:hypothetical protein
MRHHGPRIRKSTPNDVNTPTFHTAWFAGTTKEEAALGRRVFLLPAREQIGLGAASLEGMDAAT